jgi:hypothetical protein
MEKPGPCATPAEWWVWAHSDQRPNVFAEAAKVGAMFNEAAAQQVVLPPVAHPTPPAPIFDEKTGEWKLP